MPEKVHCTAPCPGCPPWEHRAARTHPAPLQHTVSLSLLSTHPVGLYHAGPGVEFHCFQPRSLLLLHPDWKLKGREMLLAPGMPIMLHVFLMLIPPDLPHSTDPEAGS